MELNLIIYDSLIILFSRQSLWLLLCCCFSQHQYHRQLVKVYYMLFVNVFYVWTSYYCFTI